MKVVINTCYGGFGLSEAGIVRYAELAGKKLWIEPRKDKRFSLLGPDYWLVPPEERAGDLPGNWGDYPIEVRAAHNARTSKETLYDRDIDRSDPALVQTVEELGAVANDSHAALSVVEIPDDVEWDIQEYDGREWVAEQHRTWP